MSKHRVLWLTKGLGRGGAERLLASAAPYLDANRFDVEVAYLVPWKDAFVSDLQNSGVTVHCLGQRSNMDMRWISRLHKLIATRRYDLVHTHMPVPAVAARLAFRSERPAFVHTEHNLWHRYRLPTYWANALTYGRNDKVIAVSQAVAGSINQRHVVGPGVTDVEVLHHGIDTLRVCYGSDASIEARRRLKIPIDCFVVGTVGNFTAKKEQKTLIDAFARLRTSRPDARLVLVGSGPLQTELQQYARLRGVSSHTLFTGIRDDVEELLPAFDVFALSSRYEGLSIALVEAMAAGVAVVVTGVGGVTEVVTNGVEGFIVRPGDPSVFASKLEELASDATLREQMASAGRKRAESFDIRVALERIEEIYEEVLGSP